MRIALSVTITALWLGGCTQSDPAAVARPQIRPERQAHVQAQPRAHAGHVAAHPPPAAPQGTSPTAAPAAGRRSFGEPIAADLPRVRLNEILGAPTQYSNRALRVEGTVAAVCQHMG